MTGSGAEGRELLIHIGYHKTGSTALQQELFCRAELGFATPWDRDGVLRDWVTPAPFAFCAARAAELYRPGLQAARARGLVPVLSHERLSGFPSAGGFDGKEIADRLASVFPGARVLIVIREQKSLLRSWYAQYVKEGGSLPLARYLQPPQLPMIYAPMFRFEFYEYHRLIEYYAGRFTAARVRVLPFELLQRDPAGFVGRITDFVGRPAPAVSIRRRNPQLPPLGVALRRWANRAFRRTQLNPDALFDAPALARASYEWVRRADRLAPGSLQRRLDRRQRAVIEAAVGERYGPSNRRTGELIGVDLREYGYA